jgi:hypothetical protein
MGGGLLLQWRQCLGDRVVEEWYILVLAISEPEQTKRNNKQRGTSESKFTKEDAREGSKHLTSSLSVFRRKRISHCSKHTNTLF